MLAERAGRMGMTPGQYLSELVMVHLYGVDELAKVQRRKLEVLSRMGAD